MERLDDVVTGRQHTGAMLFILTNELVMGTQFWKSLSSCQKS